MRRAREGRPVQPGGPFETVKMSCRGALSWSSGGSIHSSGAGLQRRNCKQLRGQLAPNGFQGETSTLRAEAARGCVERGCFQPREYEELDVQGQEVRVTLVRESHLGESAGICAERGEGLRPGQVAPAL